jgi:hypothetical protein
MPSDCAADVTEQAPKYPWDMRRRDARDAAKIMQQIMASMGCTAADLTATEIVDIETLAVCTVELDRFNAQRLRGKAQDPNLHGTIQNSYRRARDAVRALERALKKRRAARG